MVRTWKLLIGFIANRSILTKLIASLLLIVTPLYAFNFYITNIGAENNRKEIERALTNSLQSYNNILDNEFIRIQQMMSNSAIKIAFLHVDQFKPNFTYAEEISFLNQISPHLTQIQYSTRFIKDTIAYLPLLHKSQAAIGGSSSFDPIAFAGLSKPSKPILSWNNQLYINAPFVTSATAEHGDSLFILAVQLSESTISSYMSNIMSFTRGGAVLFDSEETWHISSGRDDPMSEEVLHMINEREASSTVVEHGPQIVTYHIQDEPYLIVYEQAPNSNVILAAFAPESEIYGSLDIYNEFFYILSFLTILIIVLLSFGLYRIIHKPLKLLVQAFRKVELGQMKFDLAHRNDDEFGYLYRRFNMMTDTLDNMVNVIYEQKLLNQRSELKRLQSQINPHFLYNSFFVLKRLIHTGNKEKATLFAGYLGTYFQYMTRDSSDEIQLQEDSLHAKAYVDIQSVCFDEHVSVSYGDMPDEIQRLMVPRMIIQPLIENCFEHAFEKQLQQGILQVRFHFDESFVYVEISDNGNQLDDEILEQMNASLHKEGKNNEESTGMVNVHRRIRLKFGEQSGLRLSRSELGGLQTQIVIERKDVAQDA
ncbi:sensor histidine kinase [Paenibacillus sp. strain BS8-2]